MSSLWLIEFVHLWNVSWFLVFICMSSVLLNCKMFRFSPYLWLLVVFMWSFPTMGQDFSVGKNFMKNEGQITDQFGKSNEQVIAAYFTDNLDFFINRDGFSYQLKSSQTSGRLSNLEARHQIKYHRVDVKFELPFEDVRIEFFDAAPGFDNHFSAAGSFTNIRQYQRVLMRQIYPGIDLEFVVDSAGGYPVKYNFILEDADLISSIRMKYAGQESISIRDSQQGQAPLVALETSLGELTENIPLSYWIDGNNRNEITVDYVLLDAQTIGYTYKPGQVIPANKKLIIDPTPQINWCTYFGGTGIDQANAVKLDGVGFVYFAGSTNSSSAIATSGAHQSVFGGGGANDMFLSKFDLNGNRVWTTYLGGTGDDQLLSLATDGSANIYFTGSSTSTSGIATPGAYRTVHGGSSDVVVGKFDTAGILQWCTYLGGSQNETGNGIQFFGADVYVVGSAVSTSGVASPGAEQTSFGGGAADGFICRFSDAGVFYWSTYFGGSGNDILRAVDIDSSGNLIVTGNTASAAGIATAGAHQTTFAGVNDCVVAQISAAGNRIWSTYFGGTLSDLALNVAVNSADEIIVTGFAYSTSGIATAGAFDATAAGAGDVFLNVFSSSGSRLWGTYFGGSGTDIAYALHVDPADNIFIAGNTNSTSSIATAGAQQITYGGGIADGFFAQFNTAGTLNWASYMGSTGDDYLRSVDVDVVSGAYAAGFSNSAGGISTAGVHQTSLGSAAFDAILVKYFNLSFLPINIISFSAHSDEFNSAVNCAWQVSSEQSCSGYRLERSSDVNSWQIVETIESIGSSNQSAYVSRDENPLSGKAYYKISQLDLQSNVIDSRIATVTMSGAEEELFMYPVPATDLLNLTINKMKDEVCHVGVFDISGRLIFSSAVKMVKGSNYFGLQINDLPSGQYVVQLRNADGTVINERFTK
jgi:hypothetical protein